MNWELIKNGLGINYESWMNIHMNELHSSCESGVCDNTQHDICVKVAHYFQKSHYLGVTFTLVVL
jgi:hypothetical protein